MMYCEFGVLVIYLCFVECLLCKLVCNIFYGMVCW